MIQPTRSDSWNKFQKPFFFQSIFVPNNSQEKASFPILICSLYHNIWSTRVRIQPQNFKLLLYFGVQFGPSFIKAGQNFAYPFFHSGVSLSSPSILHPHKTKVTLLVREEWNQCPRILQFSHNVELDFWNPYLPLHCVGFFSVSWWHTRR